MKRSGLLIIGLLLVTSGCGKNATKFAAQVQNREFVQAGVESFIQSSGSENPSLAIVWIVDNSRSMGEDQASLAYNFNNFIDGFLDQNIDFKMAVITTDIDGYVNRDSGGTLNLTEAKRDPGAFKANFANIVKVGIDGNAMEKGLFNTQKFLESNARWVGEDQYKIIIFVTDEDDISCLNADQKDPSCKFFVHPPLETDINFNAAINYYLPKIQRGWPDNRFLIFAITAKNCPQGAPVVSGRCQPRGNRYIELAKRSGGESYEITKPFTTVLKDIQYRVAKLIKFTLQYEPAEDSIVVKVDGVARPDTEWIYIPENREIKFKAGFVPPANSKITVTYGRFEFELPLKTSEDLIKEVLVNGVKKEPEEWYYHPETNAIRFNLGFHPPADSKIEVFYDTL